jgi:hypothetical protein
MKVGIDSVEKPLAAHWAAADAQSSAPGTGEPGIAG